MFLLDDAGQSSGKASSLSAAVPAAYRQTGSVQQFFLFLQPGVEVSNHSLVILTEDGVIVEFLVALQMAISASKSLIQSVAILLPFGISTNATT